MNEEQEKLNIRSSQKHIKNPTNLHEKLLKDIPSTDFIDPLYDQTLRMDSFKKPSSFSLKGTQL